MEETKKIQVIATLLKVNGNEVTMIECENGGCEKMGVLLRLGMAIPLSKGVRNHILVKKPMTKEEIQGYINEELDPLAIELIFNGQPERSITINQE